MRSNDARSKRNGYYRSTARTMVCRAFIVSAMCAAGVARAQVITVKAGAAVNAQLAPGSTLTVPVIVDMESAGSANILQMMTGFTWGANRIALDSVRVAPGLPWTLATDLSRRLNGEGILLLTGPAPLSSTTTVANMYFTAASNGGTRVTPYPLFAKNVAGEYVNEFMRPRRLDVCIGPMGTWGDVTGENTVNIIDAQQIARYSVGLSIADPTALAQRGDVNSDGLVNIIDAQQIARFSVGLSTTGRAGSSAMTPSVVNAAGWIEGTSFLENAVPLGSRFQAGATHVGSIETGTIGCESFTWTTSAPSVATVSASGFVDLVGLGTATITATSMTNPAVSLNKTLGVVTPPIIRLHISHAGRPAKQYIAEVSSQEFGVGVVVGYSLYGTSMNSGTLDVVVSTPGLYAVRVVAIDAASGPDAQVIAGAWFSQDLSANGVVNVPVALVAPTYMVNTVPSSGYIGQASVVEWTVTDPAFLIDGPVRGSRFCGELYSSMSAILADFSGEVSTACSRTNLGQGIMKYSNASTPLPAATSSGTRRLQLNAYQVIRAGRNQYTDMYINYLSPSALRGQAPLAMGVQTPVTSVFLPPITPVPAGTTMQLFANYSSAVQGLPIVWESLTPSVATISATGLLTAKTPGQSVIRATMAEVTGSLTATVVAGPTIASVDVTLINASLAIGATTSASAQVVDTDGATIQNPATVWTASDPRVARVTSAGQVRAIGSGTTQITGTLGNVSGSATLTVSGLPQAFDIDLRLLGTMSPAVSAAFAQAQARWMNIIRGDVPNVTVPFGFDMAFCVDQPVNTLILPEGSSIDDVIIYAKVDQIDGVGGILGQAGPCVIRSGTSFTVVGGMLFDAADIANLEANGTLTSVILHEMGHVLGIGTLWGNLLQNPALAPSVGDPTFTGVTAQWSFQNLGTGYGGATVPVENCCGDGTRNAHWRESVLQRELMTGFVTPNGGINPLSPLTISSLADIGYVVDVSQADPPPSFMLRPGPTAPRLRILERVIMPKKVVDSRGRVTDFKSLPAKR